MSMRNVLCLSRVDWLLVGGAVACFIDVRSGMAQQLEIPLPEITMEDFERAWTRLDLVAAAEKWDNAKQLAIIPALLHGGVSRLLCGAEWGGLHRHADAKEDVVCKGWAGQGSLVLGKVLQYEEAGPGRESCRFCLWPQEAVQPGLPQWEYPVTCVVVMLPHWLAKGLSVSSCCWKVGQLDQAINEATEVEYALHFSRETAEVHAVQQSTSDKHLAQLTQTMEMALQLEKLESKLQVESQRLPTPAISDNHVQGRGNQRNQWRFNCCFQCGEEGHFCKECHLNYREPVRKVHGGWQDKQ